MIQEGPTVSYSCYGCKFLTVRKVHRAEPIDSFQHCCDHPTGPKSRIDPDETPRACPFLPLAKSESVLRPGS